ncbi:MAG: GNAT family N-acetyltransferase [Burkholderiales bacterium]|nr:MAG: GNAT family N-acetyltransferase [Burkholderiales bacterium]
MRRILLDDLSGEPIRLLLEEHLRDMRAWSPPESVHALDLDKLRQPDINFWTLWDGESLLGCGALKDLGQREGEIKSMRTANAHRGQSVGAAMLTHIIAQARERGITRLNLETGSQPQFAPARALYSRFGFTVCEPFAGYLPDENSCFMTLVL